MRRGGNAFRDFVPGPDFPRTAGSANLDAYAHAERAMGVPALAAMVAGWRARDAEPFVGVTCDGRCRHGLFPIASEGAPTAEATAAAQRLLALATGEEQRRLRYPIDAPQWRQWSNPEFYVNPIGLRLDEVQADLRSAILEVMGASLSPRGLAKARDCMRMNHFLGELVDAPGVMNEYSYNFSLFGAPSPAGPWGWQLFGHHLALHCLFLGGQMVLSPTFMGAEPNLIDVGPNAGLTLFQDEEQIGLELMRSLEPALRERAQTYGRLHDPAMPPGRWHHADQRHLGGAFQDNRVIPYEGVAGAALSPNQRERLMTLVGAYLEYLPAGPLAARLAAVEAHIDSTYFSWIGGFGDEDAFYYRIQSPVIMIEFDHHSGVWLTNTEPAKCHIHTIVRTPNGNDYGKDLLLQHYRAAHPGERPVRDQGGQPWT